MKEFNGTKRLAAYIIPSSDAHNSEYLNEQNKRLKFISKFTGSSGTAIVTANHALLWTDSRFYLQAKKELDTSWNLMQDGMSNTPSISDWLCKNLIPGDFVGIDAVLYEEELFSSLHSRLNECKIELKQLDQNLVDLLMKPLKLNYNPLIKLDDKYVGKRTSIKLKEIRDIMNYLRTSSLVVTSLDEIAWLLNLRCIGDLPFTPVFFAYIIITQSSIKLFTNLKRLDDKCDNGGMMTFKDYLLGEDKYFEFYEYEEFYGYFEIFAKNILKDNKKIFLSSTSNHFLHSIVPSEFKHTDMSLLLKLKVIKSENEIQSAKRIHTLDE